MDYSVNDFVHLFSLDIYSYGAKFQQRIFTFNFQQVIYI